MNSRGSWSIEGIEPSVRERAEAAARRAGMSLEDWLNSAIREADTPATQGAAATSDKPNPAQDAHDVAEIHQRLDSIAQQIEQMSRPAEQHQPPVARQLNDAISRLDERLARITAPTPHPPQHMAEPTAPHDDHSAADMASSAQPHPASSLDLAVAEILARQGELERDRRQSDASRKAATTPASAADISGLEQQLSKITGQIEAMQQPANIEQSIAALRSELGDIHRAIAEAMPRRAIESIEHEVRRLAQRIDDNRHDGSDDQALAGVERALGEIHQTLTTLTPAEQLAGFDEAIRNLGVRLDTIVRAADDPASLQQLEGTIASLRNIVATVASNEALAQLSEHVQALATKVDQFSATGGYGETFSALEQRIATLTTALQTRPASGEIQSEQLEGALRTLSERLDRIPVGTDSSSAFAHLEQRVSYLLERLEASADHRASGLGRVEEGLQDVLRHLEQQQAQFAAQPPRTATPELALDSELVDTIKRELIDIRNSQSESERHTQDSLEAVHNTLGHVVDRLAMIESELRAARAAPQSPAAAPMAARPTPPHQRPELPNPVQAAPTVRAPTVSAAPPPAPPVAPEATPVFAASRIADDISEPETPRQRHADVPAVTTPATEPRIEPLRSPIHTELPPDHPLEPGTRPPGRTLSPGERIAASEDALSELSSAAPVEPASTSSFIAAARRAARAAASAPTTDAPSRAVSLNESIRAAAKGSAITSKIRSLLVGASVVAIVLGSFKMAMTLLDSGSPPANRPRAEQSSTVAPAASGTSKSNTLPSITSPTPLDRQSLNAPANANGATGESTASAPLPSAAVTATTPDSNAPQPAAPDITGSVPAAGSGVMPVPGANSSAIAPDATLEKLPESIGSLTLRTAAQKGNPAAAYEIAVRYSEGKGVPANLDEAAKWYDRAAQGGIVPAIFRVGTLYEKGISFKKDLELARRYYLMAAERGSAKAMHNLAVLDADGGGKGANYSSASQWFRNAAERGVADSQFNLGILYARGIGVEQNFIESFKWFSLAAAQGDADAGRKRDEIAKRLDAQSLAAAKLAVQNFVPVKQPEDAVTVAAPAGGWDAPQAKASAAKMTRTARAAH
ncbi:MAG TPA: hypothetical protein VGE73_08030 [Pseudolabrys sp.]